MMWRVAEGKKKKKIEDIAVSVLIDVDIIRTIDKKEERREKMADSPPEAFERYPVYCYRLV